MESYNTLTTTRKARYSGPEEYADAVLAAESTVSNRQASPTERAVYTTSEQALLDRIERGEARERTQDDAVLEAIRTGQEQFVGHWMPTGHDIYLSVRQRRARV
jgi:hypothetical protein